MMTKLNFWDQLSISVYAIEHGAVFGYGSKYFIIWVEIRQEVFT